MSEILAHYETDYRIALDREQHLRDMVNATRRKLSAASRNRYAIGKQIEEVMANNSITGGEAVP